MTRPSTSSCPDEGSKTWMRGTSPRMTGGDARILFPSFRVWSLPSRRASAFPRREWRPGFHDKSPGKQRAQGMPGAWPHPQPRVRNKKAHEIVTTGPPQRAGIPCANGFNGLLRALPGESGFLATIAGGSSRQLDAGVEASGPHDFAVRESRTARLSARSRPPHPAPNVRDDRDTPLFLGCGMGADMPLFWVRREGNYFCSEDWTDGIALIVRLNFVFTRNSDHRHSRARVVFIRHGRA